MPERRSSPRARPNSLPWWSRPASRVNTWLLRLGLRIGTQHILSVPGRKTGRMRSTPVSLVTLAGERYVVSGEGLAWVGNARAAGWGELLRAGRRERVRLSEIPVAERGPVLREFWHQVPHGRPFIARFFGLAPDAGPNDFEAAAPRCPVFRLEPIAGRQAVGPAAATEPPAFGLPREGRGRAGGSAPD